MRAARNFHGVYGADARKRAIELTRAGFPQAEVTRRIGCHPDTIRQWLLNAGVLGLDWGAERDGMPLALTGRGASDDDIARRLCVTPESVRGRRAELVEIARANGNLREARA